MDNDRGKIIITNFGRVIFWESSTIQQKGCDTRAYYNIKYKSHIASLSDLKQMKISFEDKRQGFYYCCARWEVCLQLSFYSYNHKDSKNSKFLRTYIPNYYLQSLRTFITGPNKHNSSRHNSDPFVINIISDKRDKEGRIYIRL